MQGVLFLKQEVLEVLCLLCLIVFAYRVSDLQTGFTQHPATCHNGFVSFSPQLIVVHVFAVP